MSVESPDAEMEDKIDPGLAPLWSRLRGGGLLWHRTSLPSFERILHSQQIVPNTGQFTESYGQSKVSYARHLGAVSLFDFDTSDEPYIFEHEWKWGTVLTRPLPAGVLIGIRRDILEPERLLTPEDIQTNDARLNSLPDKIRKGRMVIPAVEALHIGPISSGSFYRYLLTARDDGDAICIYEQEAGADVLSAFLETATTWDAEEQRRKAERRARGEVSLEELLEALPPIQTTRSDEE